MLTAVLYDSGLKPASVTEQMMDFSELFDLRGNVAVVTGGNGGVGRSLALGFARAGGAVAIVGRNAEKSQRVLEELRAIGHPAMALPVDLAQRDQLELAIQQIESTLGRMNTLVNNAGIVQLTKSMAIEPAPHNIQVNAIAPGWFETDMTAPVRTADMKAMNDEIISRTPAGRWGDPDELVGAAIFLASRASDFVTGATIPVDGGYSIR